MFTPVGISQLVKIQKELQLLAKGLGANTVEDYYFYRDIYDGSSPETARRRSFTFREQIDHLDNKINQHIAKLCSVDREISVRLKKLEDYLGIEYQTTCSEDLPRYVKKEGSK